MKTQVIGYNKELKRLKRIQIINKVLQIDSNLDYTIKHLEALKVIMRKI